MGTPAANLPTSIPDFTSSGVLPPYVGSDPTVLSGVSPYRTTLVELVGRFATSNERKTILSGFLAYRAALLAIGLTGLQWIDGSFLEDVETTESRSPNDIDVVSFIERPAALRVDQTAWEAFLAANANLFDINRTKTDFQTDSYFVDITMGPAAVIQQTAYWSGLFSHKRTTGLWKGMLELPLSIGQDDAQAIQFLATR